MRKEPARSTPADEALRHVAPVLRFEVSPGGAHALGASPFEGSRPADPAALPPHVRERLAGLRMLLSGQQLWVRFLAERIGGRRVVSVASHAPRGGTPSGRGAFMWATPYYALQDATDGTAAWRMAGILVVDRWGHRCLYEPERPGVPVEAELIPALSELRSWVDALAEARLEAFRHLLLLAAWAAVRAAADRAGREVHPAPALGPDRHEHPPPTDPRLSARALIAAPLAPPAAAGRTLTQKSTAAARGVRVAAAA